MGHWKHQCDLSLPENSSDMFLAGPLRIYRAPGSVAFLNCSNALRPILPKSQCWQVEEPGKFVLQIRKPLYWRIEVPNTSKLEKMHVEEFKNVLEKVLLFEKTPCPFERSCTVELPELPQTPVKKRPWKPVQRPEVHTAFEMAELNEEVITATQTRPSVAAISTPGQELILTPLSIFPSDHNGQAPNDIDSVTTFHSSGSINGSCPYEQNLLTSGSLIDQVETIQADIDKKEQVLPEGVRPSNAIGATIPPALSTEDKIASTGDEVSSSGELPERSLVPSPLANDLDDAMFRIYHDIEEKDNFSIATDDTNITPRAILQPAFQSMTLESGKKTRPQAMQNCTRSITVAPPVLSLVTSPPSRPGRMPPLRTAAIAESDSDFSSSVDSFHSVQSWHSPLAPPSPPASGSSSPTSTYPYPHNNIVLPKRPYHSRDSSERTVIPQTPQSWEMSPIPDMETYSRSLSPPPRTPILITDSSEKSDEEKFEIVTPPTIRSKVRHRATTGSNSRRRTLSPLPAAVNLFSPPRRRSRRLQTARHLPTAIIQKTCEILLSPPSHLLQLMLNIASKIAAGEWRGFLSGQGESVHWDFEDEYGGEAWCEDDFGISLAKTSSNTTKRNTNAAGGSWEVD